MEQLIIFNGVKVVLTTAQNKSEIQNFLDEGDVFLSVYPPDDGGIVLIYSNTVNCKETST